MNLYITILGYWIMLVLTYIFVAVNLFIFKKNKSDTTVTWKSFVWFFVVLLFLPIIVILVPIVKLYRRFIDKVLKFTYNKDYGGFLDGGDVVHVLDNADESKIKVLFIIDYEKTNTNSFYNHVKEKIYTSKLIKCPKTRAIFKKSYGYYYYLKSQVDIDSCIKQLTVANKNTEIDALMKFLEDIENIPLPGNNFGLWDVYIGTHPIDWKPENPNITYYPILFRYHHSLFDGYHLIKTIFDSFSDENMSNEKSTKIKVVTNCTLKQSYVMLRQFLELVTFPWRYFIKANANNSNILCKSKLENKKIFSHRIEDENRCYIQVIKEIKKQSRGVSFTDIILAAISSSFSKYILKNSTTIPDHITIATPEVPQATHLLLTPMQDDKARIICKNEVYFSLRNVPIDKAMSMLERLNLVKQHGGYFKNPYQIMSDYYVLNMLFTTFPDKILKNMLKFSRTTAIVTNLPGPPQTKFMSGNTLEDVLMWSISKSTTNTGIALLILTYNGRLKISLSADKAVISSKHELDEMLSNIYKSIDDLYQETCLNNNLINQRI